MGTDDENARIGYQVATNLMMGQSQVYWSKFNAMVVANSIIISVLLLSTKPSPCLILTMGIFGFLLNGIAVFMLYRSNKFHDYWRGKAADIENALRPVDTLSSANSCTKWFLFVSVKGLAMFILLMFATLYVVLIHIL